MEEINVSEWLKEIHALDKKEATKSLTDEQYETIRAAREEGIKWKIIGQWYSDKFGKISWKALFQRYGYYIERRSRESTE